MTPRKSRRKKAPVLLALLAVAAAGVGILWWQARLPSGPSQFPEQTYPAPLQYEGDPVQDTTRLLSSLNRCLARQDLLKLLDREVEKERVRIRSQYVTAYRETFRLPSRISPGDLAGRLTQAAREAGAQPLKFERRRDEVRQEDQYACSFGFTAEWTPVEIVLTVTSRPRVCLIIDDGGYRAGRVLDLLTGLKVPVTLAVIPGLEYSKEIARNLPFRGVEVLCHLPMEGSEPVKPGAYPFYLRKGLAPGRVEDYVREAVKAVPVCRGMNNHMGSVATRDADLMLQVCSVLKSLDMFFVDSKTAPDSAAARVAASLHMPCAERDVFLDNQEDAGYIQGQFRSLLARAGKKGTAVGIGHLHEATLEALAEVIPKAQDEGFVFVYASEVVR